VDLEDELLDELANQERIIQYERAAKEKALAAKQQKKATIPKTSKLKQTWHV
jgi:hypothetical protein